MRAMKHLATVALTAILAVSMLTACGGGGGASTSSSSSGSTSTSNSTSAADSTSSSKADSGSSGKADSTSSSKVDSSSSSKADSTSSSKIDSSSSNKADSSSKDNSSSASSEEAKAHEEGIIYYKDSVTAAYISKFALSGKVDGTATIQADGEKHTYKLYATTDGTKVYYDLTYDGATMTAYYDGTKSYTIDKTKNTAVEWKLDTYGETIVEYSDLTELKKEVAKRVGDVEIAAKYQTKNGVSYYTESVTLEENDLRITVYFDGTDSPVYATAAEIDGSNYIEISGTISTTPDSAKLKTPANAVVAWEKDEDATETKRLYANSKIVAFSKKYTGAYYWTLTYMTASGNESITYGTSNASATYDSPAKMYAENTYGNIVFYDGEDTYVLNSNTKTGLKYESEEWGVGSDYILEYYIPSETSAPTLAVGKTTVMGKEYDSETVYTGGNTSRVTKIYCFEGDQLKYIIQESVGTSGTYSVIYRIDSIVPKFPDTLIDVAAYEKDGYTITTYVEPTEPEEPDSSSDSSDDSSSDSSSSDASSDSSSSTAEPTTGTVSYNLSKTAKYFNKFTSGKYTFDYHWYGEGTNAWIRTTILTDGAKYYIGADIYVNGEYTEVSILYDGTAMYSLDEGEETATKLDETMTLSEAMEAIEIPALDDLKPSQTDAPTFKTTTWPDGTYTESYTNKAGVTFTYYVTALGTVDSIKLTQGDTTEELDIYSLYTGCNSKLLTVPKNYTITTAE